MKKPKYGLLGTDEGHLAFFKERGNQGRIGSYPTSCTYVRCILCSSILKFSLDFLMYGPIYITRRTRRYVITVIVGVSRSGVYVGVWGGVWGGGRCINALTRMQQQHTTDIPSGPASSIRSVRLKQ